MNNVSLLDLLILILAVFNMNSLIINEISVYFSGKSYLSKWVLRLLVSLPIILLKCYIPSSSMYILILAVAGGSEILIKFFSYPDRKDILNLEIGKRYNGRVDAPKDASNYNNEPIASPTNIPKQPDSSKPQINKPNSIANENKGNFKDRKITKSKRLYDSRDFLKESQNQNITLGTYLRSNLDNKNKDTPNKP